MRFRKSLFLIGLFQLTGCVVADMDSTNYTSFPYVQTIQKKGQLGHTDIQQRKKDLHACGLSKNIDPEVGPFNRNQFAPGETLEQHKKRINKLESCMKSKGYVLLDFGECGPLKAPTGKCN
ncbi:MULTISPECIES: hypothetical protein [unclassified Enterobacter]|uniref:hypothetical protein n=1 Tax=unclassified Enterobacter TaxID=2608935 RepID=UPI0008EE166E|nr:MULTISPECIES: hypothetical protein [unclassified Enterobacter]SFR16716.1 hypothetical protein SAMN04487773_3742 [Enterobacter sp. kpr-6]